EHARLDARRARRAIDLEHTVESSEVERDGAAPAAVEPRLDAADDARAAAVRDHREPLAGTPVENRGDVCRARRESDEVGRVWILAPQGTHDVAAGLAVGVAGAIRRIAREELRQGGRRRAAWRAQ